MEDDSIAMNSDISSILKIELEKMIATYEAQVATYIQERGLPDGLAEDQVGAFYFGLDRDGVPVSYGNADDVYSDGFDYGITEGEAMLAYKLLALLDGED
jgi:hypothetical protein